MAIHDDGARDGTDRRGDTSTLNGQWLVPRLTCSSGDRDLHIRGVEIDPRSLAVPEIVDWRWGEQP